MSPAVATGARERVTSRLVKRVLSSLVSRGFVFLVVTGISLASSGCHKKASQQECEAMLDRFAELVVTERFPDAGAAVISAEKTRERSEAQSDDSFKNCTSEVQPAEIACAMKATSSSAVIKCLE